MLTGSTVDSGFVKRVGVRLLQALPRSGGLGWDDREAVPLPCLLELRLSCKIDAEDRALYGGPGCRLARAGIKPGQLYTSLGRRARGSFGPM